MHTWEIPKIHKCVLVLAVSLCWNEFEMLYLSCTFVWFIGYSTTKSAARWNPVTPKGLDEHGFLWVPLSRSHKPEEETCAEGQWLICDFKKKEKRVKERRRHAWTTHLPVAQKIRSAKETDSPRTTLKECYEHQFLFKGFVNTTLTPISWSVGKP